IPTCLTYDPAYVYELAIIVQDGMRRMYEAAEDCFYYITMYNEDYAMPAMPEGVQEGILRGIYKFRAAGNGPATVQLFGSGPILNEVLRAQEMLAEKYQIAADVWSVTSYTELRREAIATERWNRLHPGEAEKKTYIATVLEGAKGPIVAASDYMKSLPDVLAPWLYEGGKCRLVTLGTDGFGRSDNREYLRRHFEVNAESIVGATLSRLARDGKMKGKKAQAALAPQFHQWVESTASTDPERANLPSLVVNPGAAGLDSLRREYSKPLYVLMALVGLILAIACANVANLLLARAAARRREIALRLSVGAGRFRVIRQLLTESVLLASLGGILGVLFAIWGVRFLTLLLNSGDEHFTLHAELNWHVLGVAAALSLLTGALFGLAPAMQSTRVDVISAMKETRAGQPVGRRSFGRRINVSQSLIVGQIALSLLMLVAAGLFVRTMNNLESIQLGFNRENLLLFELDARKAGHKDPEITTFYADLLKRFSAIPGVREATLSNESLIRAGYGLSLSIQGKPASGANRLSVIGPGFMKTMQIPLIAGRDIDERDQPDSPAVAIVSELFAKVNFPDENPMGQHVAIMARPGRPPRDMEIVGIAKDVRYGGLRDKARPVMYIPYNQGFPRPERMTYELRTAGDPLRYVNTVREIVHQADSLVPLANVKSEVQEIDQTINQEIIFAELCTAFAILALIIASVGLYGTISYNVARRSSEIGIRMALGARRGTVVKMILRQVFALAAMGLIIGIPAALGASKLVSSFLFGIKPNDPLAITAAVIILLAAAILAGYAPARRASRIDPMVALRHE
ncbi:MAG: ADOP family duplicated permease, partial [Bryobacteraceae bacterium]